MQIKILVLAPVLMLALATMLVLLQIALRRSHAWSVALTLGGLAAGLVSIVGSMPHVPSRAGALLTIDAFGLFFIGLILAATGAAVLLNVGYAARLEGRVEEYYLLLLMAALGACVLMAASHFAAFFIGLEILSIGLYALIAYHRRRVESLEAGLKYLILAAAASAFLLFGIALIYARSGSLEFSALNAGGQGADGLLLSAGMAMLVVGFGFKLALVPFHMWIPDVYQGAPAPTAAFIATVSKISMAALLLRLLLPLDKADHPAVYQVLGVLAFVSMVGGNLLALRQEYVKRLLAYSSIAHLGYLLTAFIAGGQTAVTTTAFYLLAYSVSIMGCFAVISVLSGNAGDADQLMTFQGLFFRHPWLGSIFALMLLSLAGIPLTAGFVGKFIVVAAGAGSGTWWLVLTLLLTSGVGLFYYLRIIVVIFGPVDGTLEASVKPVIGIPALFVLSTTTLFLIWLGIVPEQLIDFLNSTLNMAG